MSTRGLGVGTYTAVNVSATATTRAPVPSLTPFCWMYLTSGVSSSSDGRSSVRRRSDWLAQDSSTDTAAELAAAETNRHSGDAGTPGLMGASSAP